MSVNKPKRKKKEKNANYKKYRTIRVLLYLGTILMLAAGGFWIWRFPTEDYWGFMPYVYIVFFAVALCMIIGLIADRKTTRRFVTKKCDILCYTMINGRYYGKIQSITASKRAKETLYIDFYTGNFDRVVETPKILPLPKLHVLPEYLMFFAFASYFKGNRSGVEVANNFITDHKYFHHSHKKANVVYAVSFGVVRYMEKMMDNEYQSALDCLKMIAIPPKKFKVYDGLVRFCKAHAEHQLALENLKLNDSIKATALSKSALGKYAHVGRNCGNLYLAKQAEFYRVQLHEHMDQK